MRVLILVLALFYFGPLLAQFAVYAAGDAQAHWSRADRSSTGLAPDPDRFQPAVVQVYAARAYRWRGVFAVHTWLAFKEAGAADYTRYDVIGWGRALRTGIGHPDSRWVGNEPVVLFDRRGASAAKMIPQIRAAVERYPHGGNGAYTLWPGPNSNSFIADIARQVPSLEVPMPALAIGKDYAPGWFALMPTPSNTGWQLSLGGYAGFALGRVEGLELHILGQTLGIDVLRPAIKLPGLGRLGLARSPGHLS